MSSPDLDWEGLLRDTRGFLHLDDDDPVPIDELRETARSHGYSDREVKAALDATDTLEAVDVDHVRLAAGEDDPTTETPTPDDRDVRVHYRRAKPALDALAQLGDEGAPTGAFAGNSGWYTTRPATSIEDLEAGFDGYGRAKTLARDYSEIVTGADASTGGRSLYALTNYTDALLDEQRFTRGEGGKEWEGGENPLPEYADITGFAPFADIDLEGDHKERPLPDATHDAVEDALARYTAAFADLMGGYEHVFALDSVGGAYVFGAPASTAPIAERYADDRDALGRIFGEYRTRLNEWLGDVADTVREDVPAVEGVFDADCVNNKNRQYKAPLSIHKRIDGVVHPLDARTPTYDFVPLDDVDDGLIDDCRAWGEDFTDTRHADAVESVVETLWADEYDAEDVETWTDALDAWLTREREREARQDALARQRRERATGDDGERETATTLRDIYAAIDALDVERVAEKTIVRQWTDRESGLTDRSGAGKRAFVPIWAGEVNSGNANYINTDRGTWVDTANGHHGTAVEMALIAEESWTRGDIADGEDWARGVEHLRNLGFDIPEYEPADDEGPPEPEVCDPPEYDPKPFDREQRWDEFAGHRFDEFLDGDAPMIWGDTAGSGKTTNAARAAAVRDLEHVVFFDLHEKAREFQQDSATPDGYYHLRGGPQKREGTCMDADHADEECPTHGHGSNCPSMCPVHDLPRDHADRRQYEAIKREVGPVKAHQIVDPHDGEECEWLQQFSEIESEDRIVGVKEYQMLKTVRDGRICIVDEEAGTPSTDRHIEVEDLVRAGNRLDHLAGVFTGDQGENFRAFARFTRDVVDVITNPETPDTLAALDAPAVEWDERMVSDGTGDYGVKETLKGETLARLKVEYSENIIGDMKDDEWDGTPLCFDAVLAAAIAAGLPGKATREAIAAPLSLSHCPRCSSRTDLHNGARACEECGWHEKHDTILPHDPARGRAKAWIETNSSDAPVALKARTVPLKSDLPEKPLILNATPTPRAVRGLYGKDPVVTGDDPVEANMRVTQVTTGQYHYNTIWKSAEKGRGPVAGRIQSTLDTAARVHDKVLAIGKQNIRQFFDTAQNVDWMHYHATRGLNRADYDAVVCVGAPHPNMDDLRRDAELLAMDDPELDAGGEEHSTRDEAADAHARRYIYTDDDGRGRQIKTKEYTGLAGDLFRAAREDEIEQCVHRLRPVLAEETKHVYLLTNVPTALPVDELVGFDELADPLRAMLPVADGALDLLGHVRRVLDGEGDIDGFRAETLINRDGDAVTYNKRGFHRLATLCGMDVTYRTVSSWVNDLEEIGLLNAGAYEQRRGRVYAAEISTLKSALSVLHGNGSFKVEAQRRLRAKLADSPRTLDWLEWARDVFGLSGDRCDRLDGGGPVPHGAD
ncbi:hypothetical protein [Halopelagius fulvigenes]|uniref:Uncharacterized protein n=1 Tax=Halopelagius fulvigenes TaxID=1198324 RepID=A0ABD5TSB3_9EURY